MREWSRARADFVQRAPLLLGWFPGELPRDNIETFLLWIESLIEAPNETFLVVDPGELAIEDVSAPAMRAALAALDDEALSDQDRFQRLNVWCGISENDLSMPGSERVFGFVHGPFMPRYVKE